MDTELVITFAQQKTYWPGLTITQWISAAAVLATCGILVAALFQWSSSRKAHKQSHKPIIRSDFQFPSESSAGHVRITNCGLGPALLQEINIYIKGEKQMAALAMLQPKHYYASLIKQTSRPTKEHSKKQKPKTFRNTTL